MKRTGRPRESRRKKNPLLEWYQRTFSTSDADVEDIVTQLGTSRSTFYAILDGSRTPSVPIAIRIEKLTNGRVTVYAWDE